MPTESKTHQQLTARGSIDAHLYERKRRTMASNTLFTSLLGEMEQAEQTKRAPGDTKRAVVLQALKSAGLVSDDNAPSVGVMIDLIIWLSRRPDVLHIFRDMKASCGCLP